jgi:hypothetical protein
MNYFIGGVVREYHIIPFLVAILAVFAIIWWFLARDTCLGNLRLLAGTLLTVYLLLVGVMNYTRGSVYDFTFVAAVCIVNIVILAARSHDRFLGLIAIYIGMYAGATTAYIASAAYSPVARVIAVVAAMLLFTGITHAFHNVMVFIFSRWLVTMRNQGRPPL